MLKEKEVVVAFRTHYWNSAVTKIVKQLKDTFYDSVFDLIVVADETNGTVEIPNELNLVKVAHKNDFSDFGLTNVPEKKTLWWNGEYPLYVVQKQYPNAKFYLMIENDVLITKGVDVVIKNAIESGVDWIGEEVEEFGNYDGIQKTSTSNWQVKKYRSFMQILGVSYEALTELYHQRLERMKFFDGTEKTWPYVEIFIATALMNATKQFSYLDLYKSGVINDHYTSNNALTIYNPIVWRANQISHPVLTARIATEKNVKKIISKVRHKIHL